ncbi:MAG: hypothetical protein ACERLM_10730, partial [Acidimicrobiales bacterium]
LHSGESIGEVNIFDPDVASATVAGVEYAQVWRVDLKSLEDYLQERPVSGAHVLIGIAKQLSQRLREANEKKKALSEASARGRETAGGLGEHGHVRIAEIDLGNMLKNAVRRRLADFGLKTTIVAKDVGYELRCADPIPLDMEYTRDLGYCAAKYLISGGSGVMVTIQAGQFVPVP